MLAILMRAMPKTSETSKDVMSLLDQAYKTRVRDLSLSVDLTMKALAISKGLNDKFLIAKCKERLSLFFMITGDYDKCLEEGNDALELFQELDDQQGIADVKYNIAGVHYKTDNYHLGLIYLIDCLEIYQHLNDLHNQARVQKSLGTIYEYFRDEKSAIIAYEKAIDAAQKAGDLNLESNAYNPLSGIYLSNGDVMQAEKLIDRSIEMKTQTGDIRGLAFALYGKGKIYAHRRQFDQAEKIFQKSMDIHLEMGEKLGLAMVAYKMAQLYLAKGLEGIAIEQAKRALDIANTYKVYLIKFKSNYLFYQIYREKGDYKTALQYLEVYLREKESVINTQTQKVIESYEAITRMERFKREAQMQREKAEILEKKNRAEEASRVKQEFLSTMSHEIRTPLNAVITISSLLDEKPHDGEEDELIKSLRFSADNLLRIINDILDFSKLEAGKVQLETTPSNLFELLKNICNTYYGLAKEKGISLNLNVDAGIYAYYQVDQTKITQILGNLISNSIKFTDKGSVELKVKYLKTDGDNDILEFSVIDTGIGITEDFLTEIFDSFSQPKSPTTKKQGGSGLGLAIVKKLVELHESDILVTSKLGQGSRFYFTLSMARTSAPVIINNAVSGKLRGKKILLAEDNKINAMVSMKLLKNWGISAKHAKTGVEAVKMSCDEVFDFILMDIHMPEMDGFDATKTIREKCPHNAKTPIFALTADITANQQEIFSPYFDGFLPKPIEKEKLYNSLINSAAKEPVN